MLKLQELVLGERMQKGGNDMNKRAEATKGMRVFDVCMKVIFIIGGSIIAAFMALILINIGLALLASPNKEEAAYYVSYSGVGGTLCFNEFVRNDDGVTATVEDYYQRQTPLHFYKFVEDEPVVVDIGEIRSNTRE